MVCFFQQSWIKKGTLYSSFIFHLVCMQYKHVHSSSSSFFPPVCEHEALIIREASCQQQRMILCSFLGSLDLFVGPDKACSITLAVLKAGICTGTKQAPSRKEDHSFNEKDTPRRWELVRLQINDCLRWIQPMHLDQLLWCYTGGPHKQPSCSGTMSKYFAVSLFFIITKTVHQNSVTLFISLFYFKCFLNRYYSYSLSTSHWVSSNWILGFFFVFCFLFFLTIKSGFIFILVNQPDSSSNLKRWPPCSSSLTEIHMIAMLWYDYCSRGEGKRWERTRFSGECWV